MKEGTLKQHRGLFNDFSRSKKKRISTFPEKVNKMFTDFDA